MTTTANAPIIIKRKKVIAGGGHHGGAWKVAYADFVTAMMAFFMLMWLLNATTEQQRKGLADYFAPSIPIAKVSGGGAGAMGGSNPTSDSRMEFEGQGSAPFARGKPVASKGKDPAQVAALDNIEQDLLGKGGESLISDEALRHVITRVSDEGLVIELFDRNSAQLFEPGTTAPTPLAHEFMAAMAKVMADVPNRISIAAHVRSGAVVRRDDQSWPLSMGRADQIRTLLQSSGLPKAKIARATGHADQELVSPQPLSMRNNRIEVTLLYDTD